MPRTAPPPLTRHAQSQAFRRKLDRVYIWYGLGFLMFVGVLAALEQMGLPKTWIGVIFMLSSVLLYAAIGLLTRTSDATEYYVAGRRVPAMFNGMATAADWMSAASFIGLAGSLYVSGYGGLAFILGWTGGFCLVALLLAPFLRRFGQFTIPDFMGARYEGHAPRLIAAAATVLCAFTYVVAQIYGVGLITTRLSGLAFELGIFLGLGGILVCSFLGGMRAITWTQVAQCVIILAAYLVPVVWLSVKQNGHPVPHLAYGQQLAQITAKEAQLLSDPKEQAVIQALKDQAQHLRQQMANLPDSLHESRRQLAQTLAAQHAASASPDAMAQTERALRQLPRDPEVARQRWTQEIQQLEERAKPLNGMPRHAQAFKGDPEGTPEEQQAFQTDRRNFLALVFCLTFGTAALPHILMRYYTTPTVKEARESVAWSLFFIVLLYITAPTLAVMLKDQIFNHLVGSSFDQLPAWISAWSRIDGGALLQVQDVNRDGILQLAELRINPDILVLAAPEIAGLPYVMSGMVAAGGLAAALSTADGLLLTISSAFAHDVYYRVLDPKAPTARRVAISKVVLLAVAVAAAWLAARKGADIVFLVSAAFSIAASAFFPALVLGVFWKRANLWGACAGMLAGTGVCAYYIARTHPWVRELLGFTDAMPLWWDIQPISAGVFGVPVGFAVIILVSLLTPRPSEAAQALVERIRVPRGSV